MTSYYFEKRSAGRLNGFSLVEMLVTVAVVGIMTGIMLNTFTNVKRNSSEIIATELMETVNLGVKKYSQTVQDIATESDDDTAADEALVLGILQTRDDTVPGTPFVRPDWSPVASSSKEDYRIQWAGKFFQLLEPGTDGHGIKVDFQAGDYD